MTQDKILIARHVHRLEKGIMAMVCYCGGSAFGSTEGELFINTVFNFKPFAVLGTAYMYLLSAYCVANLNNSQR